MWLKKGNRNLETSGGGTRNTHVFDVGTNEDKLGNSTSFGDILRSLQASLSQSANIICLNDGLETCMLVCAAESSLKAI